MKYTFESGLYTDAMVILHCRWRRFAYHKSLQQGFGVTLYAYVTTTLA